MEPSMLDSILRRFALLSAASVALLLSLAMSAQAASTAGYTARDYFNGQEEEPDEFEASRIRVVGDAGVNSIVVSQSGDALAVSDASGITAKAGCTQTSPTVVFCPKADYVSGSLGAGDDTFSADPVVFIWIGGGADNDTITGNAGAVPNTGPVGISGEAGDDVLTVTGGYATGDDGDDRVTGGDRDEQLRGGAGKDTIMGGTGADGLVGGPGRDDLDGGAGDDTLDGDRDALDNPANDALEDDDLDGGEGSDTLDWSDRTVPVSVDLSNPAPDGAEGEKETITGIENVTTGPGADTIVAADAGGTIDPGLGVDSVTGGPGPDFIQAGDRLSETFDLGEGSDTVSYEQLTGRHVTVNLADPAPDGPAKGPDTLIGVENAIGTMNEDDAGDPVTPADVLIGDAGPNILIGLHGKDRIEGGGGNDELYGEGRGVDYSREGLSDAPDGGASICVCGFNGDRLRGGAGDDKLEGGLGSDFLDGGAGNDAINGDLAPPLAYATRGDKEFDIVDYSSRRRTVEAVVGSGGGEGAEKDTYVGVDGIRGGRAGDSLIGRKKRADRLFGGGGGDMLNGLTGKDRLFGQKGRDLLVADDGIRDRVDCGGGRDAFWADAKDRLRSCEKRRAGRSPTRACKAGARASGCVILPDGVGRSRR
jgi:Ca2+-binding RTX toxin-like protein